MNAKEFAELKRNENPDCKIVATNGCFDVIHAGHISMLKSAKIFGDFLIVGLNSDKSVKSLKGASRPVNSQENRKYLLEELRCVDFVEIFESTTCEDFLTQIKPDIYVKSGDYSIDTLNSKEKEALSSCGADIKIVKFIKDLSSSRILSKI